MRFPQKNERESALDGNSSPRHAHHKEEKKAKKQRPQIAGQFFFFLKDKISSPRHAWKKEKQRKNNKKGNEQRNK